jgi:hypothetical protein
VCFNPHPTIKLDESHKSANNTSWGVVSIHIQLLSWMKVIIEGGEDMKRVSIHIQQLSWMKGIPVA